MTNQQKFSTNLRALATWYDEHPDVSTPSDISLKFSVTKFSASPEEIRAMGPGKKKYDDLFFAYVVEGDGFNLRFLEYRDKVCVKKVVGTKLVPEIVLEAREASVIPAHEEEVYEWQCPGSLLSPEQEVA